MVVICCMHDYLRLTSSWHVLRVMTCPPVNLACQSVTCALPLSLSAMVPDCTYHDALLQLHAGPKSQPHPAQNRIDWPQGMMRDCNLKTTGLSLK
jgi:hypothetical protein